MKILEKTKVLTRFSLIIFGIILANSIASAPLEKVTFQLKWKHQFQFAGYYAAKEKGFYQEEGLDVEIIEANELINPMDSVIAGQADFGTGTTELLLKYHDNAPVVVLATIFQHSPLQIMAKNGNEVKKIEDLINKSVMLEPHSAELVAYLLSHNININQLNLVAHSFNAIDLINDKVAAMSVYSTDEPFALQQQGIEFTLFSPTSSGINFYGDNLFTTVEQVKTHPERVEKFRRASLKGWQYALEHPAELVDIIYKQYSKRHSLSHLNFEAVETIKLIDADNTILGNNDIARWHHIANVYNNVGMLNEIKPLSNFIYAPLQQEPIDLVNVSLLLISLASLVTTVIFGIQKKQLLRLLNKQKSQFDTAPIATILLDSDNKLTHLNYEAQNLFGWQQKDIIHKKIIDKIVTVENQHHFEQLLSELDSDDRLSATLEAKAETQQGHLIDCRWYFNVLVDDDNSICAKQIQVIDISSQILEQNRVHRFRAAIDSISDSIFTLDEAGNIRSVNEATLTMLGYKIDDVVDKPFSFIFSSDTNLDELWKKISENKHWQQDAFIRHHQGRIITAQLETSEVVLTNGTQIGYVAVIKDISELKEFDRKLRIMQHYDQLTGLPNRSLFFQRFDEALNHAKESEKTFAVMLINIEQFHEINRQFGHIAGDDLLKHIARRFVRNINHTDTIARLGGDEFAILFHIDQDVTEVTLLTNKLRHELVEQFIIDGKTVKIEARFGAAIFPEQGTYTEELIESAYRSLVEGNISKLTSA